MTGTGNAVNGTGGLVGHNGGSISGSDATVAVTGLRGTGGLVGSNYGPINNSYATGNVSGSSYVGGLVGYALAGGNISNSHATGQVSGTGHYVGGLVGVINGTTVAHSYATGTAGGGTQVGGLVGSNSGGGTISDSYATGNVTGTADVGGLVGFFQDPQINFLSNAFYNVDQVTINGMHLVAAGGIFNAQYVDWFGHGETLSIANYVASLPAGSGGYYNVSSVQGLEDLLGFSESNAALNFRLTANLSLPQGFSIPYFAGSFDGGSHTLANLALATNNSEVGLFGYLPSSATTIANVGVSNVSVTGNEYVGGLVGYDKAGASISNSYASGSITGVSVVGGLVGRLNSGGGISNSYFSGSVTETSYAVGGLVGASYGTISTSYAQGSVTGTAYYIGGLVGLKYGSVTNSFYDKSSNPTLTGLSNYSHPIADVAGTVEGLTTAQFESPTTFTSATGANGNFNPAWNLSTAAAGSSGWFMYAGQTAPLLRSFMTPLTVGGGATIQVYDAIAFAPTVGNMVYSSPPDMTQLLGSLTITGTAASAVHTGTYTYVPGGLYSDQQGYLISYISSRLTINPAALNVSGTTVVSKVYDGSTVAALAGGSLIGLFGADSVSLTQAGSFATKNIGTGIAVTAADSLSGSNAGDYVLVDPAGLTGNITPATLTVSGTTVGGKVYDGTTVALLTGGSLVGLIGADSVSLTQAGNFATKNAGSGIAVTAVDSLSGASAADYSIVEPTGLSGSILPAPPSTPGGPGGTSGLDALLLDALNARTQIVENFIYPQLGANPQEIDALPTIGMLATAADDASEDSTSRHKAIAVNVSMRIGANGSLKIENGGLRLPSTLVVGNK